MKLKEQLTSQVAIIILILEHKNPAGGSKRFNRRKTWSQ